MSRFFSVRSIDHVEVFVRDIDAAIRWYGDVLGLREVARWDPEPVMVGAGGTKLALFRAPEGSTPTPLEKRPALRWHRVAWLVPPRDFAAAQENLRKRAISFRGPVDHGGSWSIYFQDPDGNPLEITYLCPEGSRRRDSRAAAKSSARPGARRGSARRK